MGKHRRRRTVAAAVVMAGCLPGVLLFSHHHGYHHQGSDRNRTANADCTLRTPRHPLSAQGLAVPYVLQSAGTACSEVNPDTAAFVQATIFDPATGAFSVYDPVVTSADLPPVTPPPVPVLPPHAVITVWTGFNGNVLRLTGPGAKDFTQFPQQSYAGSPHFFAMVNENPRAQVPALGTATDGLACPTSRDWSIVDQDPSDNNPEKYLVNGTVVSNASDEGTLVTVDAALGCAPIAVPLLDPSVGTGAVTSSSGPLQELQAAAHQAAPAATVPSGDPFTLDRHGNPSLFNLDVYRLQVDQVPVGYEAIAGDADTKAFCVNLATIGAPRLALDAATEAGFPNTLPIGSNLANQLANRFVMTWANLGCADLTGMASPIQVTLDGDVAVAATYPQ